MLNVKNCSVLAEIEHSNHTESALNIEIKILSINQHLSYGVSVFSLALINIDIIIGYVSAEDKLNVFVL